MAYATRVTFKPGDQDEIYVEPPWWNVNELIEKNPFIKKVEYYVDYELRVSKKELEIMANSQVHNLTDEYDSPFCTSLNGSIQKELQIAIDKMDKADTAIIWIFEWESGLD